MSDPCKKCSTEQQDYCEHFGRCQKKLDYLNTPKIIHNTTVRCNKCGKTQKVDFALCLATGWPKCCGYTMTMIKTHVVIGEATKAALNYPASVDNKNTREENKP